MSSPAVSPVPDPSAILSGKLDDNDDDGVWPLPLRLSRRCVACARVCACVRVCVCVTAECRQRANRTLFSRSGVITVAERPTVTANTAARSSAGCNPFAVCAQ